MQSILVADEDRSIVSLYEHAFRQKGFRVSTARTGRECLEGLSRHQPDILILDSMLGDMDGLDLVRQLRDDSDWDHCQIIIMTSDEDELREDPLRHAVSDVLLKPVSLDSLVRRVCELAQQPAVCAIGSLA